MIEDMSESYRLALAQKRLDVIRKNSQFSPDIKGSKPNIEQERILKDIDKYQYRYVLGGNQSGKSLLGARELTWFLTDTHPYYKRSEQDKANRPVRTLVIGSVMATVETEIWEAKIQRFLETGTYKIDRTHGLMVRMDNGATIMFASHDNEQMARQRVQGLVLDYVWLDEMCDNVFLLEELHRRTDSAKAMYNTGFFLATFTPKLVRPDVKAVVDSESEYSHKYQLHKFDNPIYSDADKERIMASLQGYSKDYIDTILSGAWYVGSNAVFDFTPSVNVRELTYYSPSWRHVVSVDPAASSFAGLTVWAEDPNTNKWYCIISKYLEGKAGSELVTEIETLIAGINVYRRVYDTNASWFAKEAKIQGIKYMGIYSKATRKMELIKTLQERLTSDKIRIIPSCKDLISELQTCQWSDSARDKIVKAQKYHLLDSAQYAIDMLPKPVIREEVLSTGDYYKDWTSSILRESKKIEADKRIKKMKVRRRR
jgi:hypothetical protein